ncbi:MAG: hypothetical protein HZA50_19550 [Planctomycetes bacterium]|nr:hypothetical protein [Planctomycetota bacterium]
MKSCIVAILAGLIVAGCGNPQGPNPNAAGTQPAGKETSYPVVTLHKDLTGLVGKRVFVQGVAENRKYAAFVAGVDVFVWDKSDWPDSVVGKSVLVLGDLAIVDDRATTRDSNGEIRQTSSSVLYVLKNAKWELVKPKK